MIQLSLGFVETENTLPLAEKEKDFLGHPPAFVADTLVVIAVTSASAGAVASAKISWVRVIGEHTGFGLFDKSPSKLPTQPAYLEKHRNKSLFPLKK